MNRYVETAYFMQKIAEKFGTNYSLHFVVRETAQAFEKSCTLAIPLAVSMLKLLLRATFLPIRLALSGIFAYLQPKQADCLTFHYI